MGRQLAAKAAALVGTAVVMAALGATAASAHRSSSPYVCAYGKRAGKAGNVYLALGVTPKSVGPLFCTAFNRSFGGKHYSNSSKLGTGHIYCKYEYSKNSITVVSAVFADKAAAGRAFCGIYHPRGWKRF